MTITEKKETHRYIENKLVVTSGKKAREGQEGVGDSEIQTTVYKISYGIYGAEQENKAIILIYNYSK